MIARSKVLCLLLWLSFAGLAGAAENLPPAPKRYFNDYAQVVSPATAEQLNRALEEFEKTGSSQIVVAIFPKLPPDAALEDFTVRTFQAWKVGQAGKDNGAVLFAFVQERRLRIEVGYGLEGALPDSLAKQIIDEEIRPRLQSADWNGAMTAGVTAMMQATRGEYQGSGQTVGGGRNSRSRKAPPFLFLIFFFVFILMSIFRRRGTVYNRGGHHTAWGVWPGGGWGGGSSGGGGWGGGGGGFSGGGGRSGGGGASGGW